MDTQALYAAAEQVRDEHADNANTANRVGNLFYAIVEAVADVSSSVSALSLRISALENGSGGSSGGSGGITDTSTLQTQINSLKLSVSNLQNLLKMA
jgi:hypothetical protein